MNDELSLQHIANKLIERWKTVMAEGQKAKDAQNEITINLYQQERQFLENLIEEISKQSTICLEEWQMYKQRPAPDIFFSPDSTFIQHRF